MDLIQHKVVSLDELGKDERWLQNEIAQDPSILGLGDLERFRKERKQSSGGRVDLILVEKAADTMYEVEIMLGATDPSHIIRTLEYWDIESRRILGHRESPLSGLQTSCRHRGRGDH